jgi:hypothetical protein
MTDPDPNSHIRNVLLRTGLLEVLAAADRAGIMLSYVTGSRGTKTGAIAQASDVIGRPMSRAMALTITQQLGPDGPAFSEPTEWCRHSALSMTTPNGTEVTLVCRPTWDEWIVPAHERLDEL